LAEKHLQLGKLKVTNLVSLIFTVGTFVSFRHI